MKNKVKEMRLHRLMTQEELAKKAGVTRQTVISLESGRQKRISALTLARLADALQCTIDDLIFLP